MFGGGDATPAPAPTPAPAEATETVSTNKDVVDMDGNFLIDYDNLSAYIFSLQLIRRLRTKPTKFFS
jgi:hypothetical protein